MGKMPLILCLEIIHCRHLNSIRFLLVFLQQLLQNALQALINF